MYADQAAKTATIEKQRHLDALIEQIEKGLASIAEGVNRAHQFRNRLLNARPESVGVKETAEPPSPNTIEGRLARLARQAEGIGSGLHGVCSDLDSAA